MLLDQILIHVPCPIFWKNIDGAFLGCNELFLAVAGFHDYSQLIGKKDDELPWKEHKDEYYKDDQYIINTGETITRIETIPLNGRNIISETTKTPLMQDGKIIGVLGICLDITDRHEKEHLKLENEIQKRLLEAQEEFRDIVAKVNHDIRSPLASLQMLTAQCETLLPEQHRMAYNKAIARILGIANNMMAHFKPNSNELNNEVNMEETKPILISTELLEILTEKKYEYANSNIEFINNFEPDTYFTFINTSEPSFKRMLSNIINNAVDAYENEAGDIIIKLNIIDNNVVVTIEDHGKGMPESVKNKILSNIAITKGKKSGHGIGFQQIRETLFNSNGVLNIESKPGYGTKIILTFPKFPSPKWIAEKLEIKSSDLIIILDDDPSIHEAWDTRIKQIAPAIKIKHFQEGQKALSFINSLDTIQKDNLFLLTDYELLKQDLNGLDVVSQSEVKHSVLVTSHSSNPDVLAKAAHTKTKVLPKLLASEIPIIIKNVDTPEVNVLEKYAVEPNL